jgi:hypothetical protein
MVDSNFDRTFTPSEVAQLIGEKTYNIRRWCEYHAELLEGGANPGRDQARRLTRRDIEVMREIKKLRDANTPTSIINEKLRTLTFAVVDSDLDSNVDSTDMVSVDTPSQDLTPTPPQTVQEALQLPAPVLEVYVDLAKRVQALEAAQREARHSRYDGMTMFVAGVLAAAIFFMLILFLRWLTVVG